MNAQLPQIVNENVFPNGCSFWGVLCFPGVWPLVAAALLEHDKHSTSGNECDLHSGCLWVLQKLGNFPHCFVPRLMWGVSSIILGNKSLDAQRRAWRLQKNKIKRWKSTLAHFCQSMPGFVRMGWNKSMTSMLLYCMELRLSWLIQRTITQQNELEENRMQMTADQHCVL